MHKDVRAHKDMTPSDPDSALRVIEHVAEGLLPLAGTLVHEGPAPLESLQRSRIPIPRHDHGASPTTDTVTLRRSSGTVPGTIDPAEGIEASVTAVTSASPVSTVKVVTRLQPSKTAS